MRYFGLDETNKLLPHLSATFEKVRDLAAQAKVQRAAKALGNLAAAGMVVKDPSGRVDLPARYAGRTVLLCWELGESEVGHFHELHEPCEHRQEIEHRAAFKPAYLS